MSSWTRYEMVRGGSHLIEPDLFVLLLVPFLVLVLVLVLLLLLALVLPNKSGCLWYLGWPYGKVG
jgi:hypothetical protein